jgi:hypothetical protein
VRSTMHILSNRTPAHSATVIRMRAVGAASRGTACAQCGEGHGALVYDYEVTGLLDGNVPLHAECAAAWKKAQIAALVAEQHKQPPKTTGRDVDPAEAMSAAPTTQSLDTASTSPDVDVADRERVQRIDGRGAKCGAGAGERRHRDERRRAADFDRADRSGAAAGGA